MSVDPGAVYPGGMRHRSCGQLILAALFSAAAACDGEGGADAGGVDGGMTGADAGATDAGATDAGDPPRDAAMDASDGVDGGGSDAGGADAAGPVDGGGACPCFGAAEIATIEAHAAAGGTRGCMTGCRHSSSRGAQVLQVDVQEISGFAGFDWTCASGCSDLNDDTIDDCAGAALGTYSTMIVSEAEHDACEALIEAACDG